MPAQPGAERTSHPPAGWLRGTSLPSPLPCCPQPGRSPHAWGRTRTVSLPGRGAGPFPEIRDPARPPLPDGPGTVILIAAVSAATLGLVQGPAWHWDIRVIGCFLGAAGADRRAHRPLRPAPRPRAGAGARDVAVVRAGLPVRHAVFLSARGPSPRYRAVPHWRLALR